MRFPHRTRARVVGIAQPLRGGMRAQGKRLKMTWLPCPRDLGFGNVSDSARLANSSRALFVFAFPQERGSLDGCGVACGGSGVLALCCTAAAAPLACCRLQAVCLMLCLQPVAGLCF